MNLFLFLFMAYLLSPMTSYGLLFQELGKLYRLDGIADSISIPLDCKDIHSIDLLYLQSNVGSIACHRVAVIPTRELIRQAFPLLSANGDIQLCILRMILALAILDVKNIPIENRPNVAVQNLCRGSIHVGIRMALIAHLCNANAIVVFPNPECPGSSHGAPPLWLSFAASASS